MKYTKENLIEDFKNAKITMDFFNSFKYDEEGDWVSVKFEKLTPKCFSTYLYIKSIDLEVHYSSRTQHIDMFYVDYEDESHELQYMDKEEAEDILSVLWSLDEFLETFKDLSESLILKEVKGLTEKLIGGIDEQQTKK